MELNQINETMGGAIPAGMSVQQRTPWDIYDVSHYPWWCLNYFLIFWFLSNVTERFFLGFADARTRSTFVGLDSNKRNNVVIYIIQIVGTTAALFLQIWGGIDVVFRWEDETSPAKMELLQVSLQLLVVLYIWELIYRKEIGLPLLVHHIVTIANMQLIAASFFDTHAILYIRFAVLIGFHATTEQLSFVALYLYRMNAYPRWQAFWFYFSGFQAFAVKTLVTVATAIYYIVLVRSGEVSFDDNWGAFWIVFFPIMTVCLYGAQVYACRVLYLLGKKSQRNADKMAVQEDGTDEETELPDKLDPSRLAEATESISSMEKGLDKTTSHTRLTDLSESTLADFLASADLIVEV